MSPQTLELIVCVVVTGCVSGRVKVVVSPDVTVLRGEDAVLGCSFTDPRQQRYYSGQITVHWSAKKQNAAPFLTCSGIKDSTPGFTSCLIPEFRFSLNGDPRRGDVSLLIRTTQLGDEGSYFCTVELKDSTSYKKIELQVKAQPQILSLSVVDAHSSPDGAARRLRCEAQGNPRPKIVWLSSSKRMMENQGAESQSGQYGLVSSVPYPKEGEELICRAENALGDAERMYPPCHMTLMITLVVCGVVVLLLLSTGGNVYCRRNRAEGNSADVYENTEADNGDNETSLVYSTVTLPSPASYVLYSPVTVPH
ncbi:sialic acid-binding Ig-like lectin 15 [Solea solea]|uniref:sialic acid-binding Ig-like lectin 15 n=1 Tax=Solea solea TaxID=90069 RepID=UPI00272BC1AA|nr:sialic acid-binding Ig-like lectin 15 [Solea solea]